MMKIIKEDLHYKITINNLKINTNAKKEKD
jgi:hypothetical protein